MAIPVLWLAVHFVADFVLQSNWMAQNKSKRWDALALHCVVYGACWLWLGLTFAAVTCALHFLTDAVTSRITSRLWFFRMKAGIWEQASFTVPKHGQTLVNPWMPEGGDRHYFFVAIGADQVIHYATLAATGYWLGTL